MVACGIQVDNSEAGSPVAERLRVVADLAGNLRNKLGGPVAKRRGSAL